MFQFPGFALLSLCIQPKSTWFTPLMFDPVQRRARPPQGGHGPRVRAERALSRSDNNRISSGLPHSEIEGSKGILTSPSLIAEYHVLHRLLLPRHPPNALIALDLIQKEPDILYVLPLRYLSTFYSVLPPKGLLEHVISRATAQRATRAPRRHTCPTRTGPFASPAHNPDQKHSYVFPAPP